MCGPSTPAAGIKVQVRVLDPINWSAGGTTNRVGIARVPIEVHGTRLGMPVIVDVAATWHHVTYQRQTSFTPAPGGRPPQPSGSGDGTPSHGKTPTPTPNARPRPMPTVTPNARPTPPSPPQPTPLPTPQATSTATTTPPQNPTASPAAP